MAQDTNLHSEHKQPDTHNHKGENKSLIASRSSFWFIIILIGVFIAALNFVNVMGSDTGEEKKTEETAKPVPAQKEASASQTLAGETGVGKSVDSTARANMATDTAHQEKH